MGKSTTYWPGGEKIIWGLALSLIPILQSCTANEVLTVDDITLVAGVYVVTPEAGEGESVSIRIDANRDELEIDSYDCEFGLFSGSDAVTPHTSYRLSDGRLNLIFGPVSTDRNRTVSFTITVKDPDDGTTLPLEGEFNVIAEKINVPGTISFSTDQVRLCPGQEGEEGTFADIDVIFPSDENAKEFTIEVDRSGVIEVTEFSDRIRIAAPENSNCGNATVIIRSAYNPLVSDSLKVLVRKDVALVITGRSCGDKSRVTWNRYMSYRFEELYCYVATVSGDIVSAIRSSDKNASSLSFSTFQAGFDYNVTFSLERMSRGSIATVTFPYKCRSNARMNLTELMNRVNGETDRKTRDDDTGYQYYTFRVSNLSYSSDKYNIRYIIHLYKARDSEGWIACKTFSKGYNLEKNKYWYAAADTDEWIIERE